jgi:ABC-2 type transport system permease protein
MVAARFGMGMLGGQLLPLELFPQTVQQILAWLPFPYLYAVPTRTLLGTVHPAEWIAGMAITLFWCGIAAAIGRAVWRRGDLQYTGVGM